MPKKIITNHTKPSELKEKIEDVEQVPQNAPETPEITVDEVKLKDSSELTDAEQTLLEENAEKLTPEEKAKFSIDEDSTPRDPKAVKPVEEEPKPEVAPEVTPENEPEPEKDPEDIDYKERYVGSTREAQVLAARNKQLVEAIENAGSLPEPTEDEMKAEYGTDWEVMDEVQRKIARDSYKTKKSVSLIHEAVKSSKKVDEWVENVHKWTADPQVILKYPQLEGREIEFAQFCQVPTRVGVNLDDLVKAFTFDIKPSTPKHQNLFETSKGGEAPKPKTLSVEEITFIRTHDPKQYKQLINQGKIKIEI